MKKKRVSKGEQYRVILHSDPESPRVDLAIYADSLVLLHGNVALDAALNLAHNITVTAHQCDLERHLLEARADHLRLSLAEIEERLRTTRTQ